MDRESLLRLGVAASGVSPVRARRLFEHAGSWEAAAREAASRPGVPERLREAFGNAERHGERVAVECRTGGIRVLWRGGAGWPPSLEALTDPPEVLFLRGGVPRLAEPALAVVGTRECSTAGAEWTDRVCRRLADAGWGTVSGLARGIDAAAHRGSLAAGGDTVAVLGCGADVAYPPEHRDLLDRIAAEGTVVSEFPPGSEPRPHHFPRRNRILAALAHAVLVVECRTRSGALITARHALELGRDVYAVPGWPTSPTSDGTLALLRDGARLVRGADDLLEDLGGIPGVPAPDSIGDDDARALAAVRDGAVSAETLAQAIRVTPREARERLARLELLGRLPREAPRA